MLKVYLELLATKDIDGWKEGDVCKMITDVFDVQNGIAYHPLKKGWKIMKMELKEYKTINE